MQRVQRKSFDPREYDSNVFSDGDEYDIDLSDSVTHQDGDITTKGDKKAYKIDLVKFDGLCEHFRKHPDESIAHLSKEDREKFNMIVSYVQLLYDTDYYKNLYKRVQDKFQDLKSVKPGTVGGYLAGCLSAHPVNGNSGCAATCAGALPLPKGHENHKLCDKAVIWSTFSKEDGFKFNLSKHPDKKEDLNPCYVYVPFTTINHFAGFNKAEKEALNKLGVSRVHLYGYDEEQKHYDLYGAPVDVKDIKIRSRLQSDVAGHQHKGGVGLAIILVLIFLVLIILFFGWRLWNNRYQ